jgi:hypothetical protein
MSFSGPRRSGQPCQIRLRERRPSFAEFDDQPPAAASIGLSQQIFLAQAGQPARDGLFPRLT